jgi:protease IV
MASDSGSSHPGPLPTPSPNAPWTVPTRVTVEMAESRWERYSRRVAWIGFGICGLLLISQSLAFNQYFATTEGIQERYHSGARFARDKIAIITISGIIADGSGFVKRQIDQVREDQNIKGIVVRVNSPGGTVTGSDFMLHHLNRLRVDREIPLVVSMGSTATSGGYYVSMAVGDQPQSIYAEPTTTTGSIGVIIPHYNLSGLLARWDVEDDSITSHPRKQMLSMTRPIPEEHRELLQLYVNESFERFKEVVQQGRPAFRGPNGISHEGLDLATGEIFSAQRAKQYGLIDEIGFLEEAIDRVLELANLDKSKTRVIEYRRQGQLIELFSGMAEARHPAAHFQDWLEYTQPRAYFLPAAFPPLVPPSAPGMPLLRSEGAASFHP